MIYIRNSLHTAQHLKDSYLTKVTQPGPEMWLTVVTLIIESWLSFYNEKSNINKN